MVSILTLASSKDSRDGTIVKVTQLISDKDLPFREVCLILEVGRNLLGTSILPMWKCISVRATGRSTSIRRSKKTWTVKWIRIRKVNMDHEKSDFVPRMTKGELSRFHRVSSVSINRRRVPNYLQVVAVAGLSLFIVNDHHCHPHQFAIVFIVPLLFGSN